MMSCLEVLLQYCRSTAAILPQYSMYWWDAWKGRERVAVEWSSVALAHTQSLFPGHRVWAAQLRTWGPVTLSRTQAP